MIYIIIMITCAVITFPIRFCNREGHKYKKRIINICLILSFSIAYFFMAFRYDIGTDYMYTYVPHFFGIANGTMEFSELGFNYLNKIIYSLTGDYRVLFAVTSFMFLFFIYKGIKENSTNITISVLMIFLGTSYFYSMNIVRQAIAIAIVFYAYKYIKEKKLIKYILACIIASTIHSSAIIMILLYFVANIKISRKTKMIIFLIFMVASNTIVGILTNIIVNTRFSVYFGSVFDQGQTTTLLLLVNITYFLLSLYYENKEDKDYNMLCNINFIACLIILLMGKIPLIDRVARYFTIFQILLVPKFFEQEKNTSIRIALKLVLMGALLATIYYQIILLGGEGVYPYKSIFDM